MNSFAKFIKVKLPQKIKPKRYIQICKMILKSHVNKFLDKMQEKCDI